MKKTPHQKAIIRENNNYLHIRNWLTGEHRICRKQES